MSAGYRTRWGWHCLIEPFAEQIVRDARISSRHLVLDVGAGTGVLTAALVETGARVIAIELHQARFAQLEERFASNTQVSVVRHDARSLRLPGQPFDVVANPPFAITTQLVRQLTQPRSLMEVAHLVVQRSAARRLVGRWHRFEIRIAQNLPRTAFVPRPHVDIAVIRIARIRSQR